MIFDRINSQFRFIVVFGYLTIITAYSNVFGNSFIYDDEFLIQRNQLLRTWDGLWRAFTTSSTGGAGGQDAFYRPLQVAIYTLVYQFFGPSTAAFHTLNLFLHLLNFSLLALLALNVGFSATVAGLAALLWAIHPIQTEAVTYMSATADSLYVLFVLLGLLIILPRKTPTRYLGALLCFVLALLSKESAIVFPAALASILFVSEERWRLSHYFVTIPFWLCAFGYLLLRMTVLHFDGTFNFYKTSNVYTESIILRSWTFLATLPNYFWLLIFPHNLHMDRSFPVYTGVSWEPMIGVLILIALLSCLWFERNKKFAFFSFASLWFLTTHSPHTGVFVPVNALFLEHWMYLPSQSLFLATTYIFLRDKPAKRYQISALFFVIVFLAILTYRQNQIWKTPIRFFTHIIDSEPRVPRVRHNLASAYADAGDPQKAMELFKEAIALSDTYSEPHHNLALLLIQAGKYDEAKEHLERALQINPNFFYSARVLRDLYKDLNQPSESEEYDKIYREILKRLNYQE